MAGQGLMNHRYLIKKNFKQKLKHSNLNAEKMTNAYYKHSKKEIKSLGDYHDLYSQSNTLLLFENFRKKWIEIFELHPANFLSAPGLTLKIFLKKDQIRIRIVN